MLKVLHKTSDTHPIMISQKHTVQGSTLSKKNHEAKLAHTTSTHTPFVL